MHLPSFIVNFLLAKNIRRFFSDPLKFAFVSMQYLVIYISNI